MVRRQGEGPGASSVAGPRLDAHLGRPLPIGAFLDLAVGLAKALDAYHRRGHVHRHLQPALVSFAADGVVEFIGDDPDGLPAAFAYMAPEQTGRMGRHPDARADLYSLGVIFYEMLTGGLPFTATDPVAWAHCHIARQPVPPAATLPAVPVPLSDLVMKLLAKDAEDRYQTAAGLLTDLQRCQAQWRAGECIEAFPLGEGDGLGRLRLPERLYGRDQPFATLQAAFQRVAVAGRAELVLVSGPSGIGKSSLVRRLREAMERPEERFLSGKCDPYRRNVPYDALAQALRQRLRYLAAQEEREVEAWRSAFLEALGPNLQLLGDLLPELQLVTGPLAAPGRIASPEGQRRFQAACRHLLAVLGRGGQPLVLFLDDVQWLDAATLKLFDDWFLRPDALPILVVGTCRDHDPASDHALAAAVGRWRQGGAVTEIALSPLSRDDVERLLAEALGASAQPVEHLARLVYQKTAGNPFFVIHYLSALAEEGLLAFDLGLQAWTWDGEGIAARGFADNVAELMATKLQRMSAPIQSGLRLLACFGQEAEAAALGLVRGESPAAIHADLAHAVRAGLVLHRGDAYRFAHDRIREAAYALIPAAERPRLHLDIARRLSDGWPAEAQADHIFDLANQFNRGIACIDDPEERLRAAAINLQAGQRAQGGSAWAAAVDYFAAGYELLPSSPWENDYDLAFGLGLGLAGGQWLLGDFGAATALLAVLEEHAGSVADQARAYAIRISIHVTRGEIDAAVDIALCACRRWFGLDLPRHPEPDAAAAGLAVVRAELAQRPIEDLVDLPPMADPARKQAAAMISAALPAMYFTDPRLHDLACCQVVRWSLVDGNTEASAHAYAVVGASLGQVFEAWPEAYRLGLAARQLADRHGPGPWRSAAGFVATFFIDGWVCSPEEVIAGFRNALQAARECGELNHACYAASALVTSRLRAGHSLPEVRAEAEKQLGALVDANYDAFTQLVVAAEGFACRLMGRHGRRAVEAGDDILPPVVKLPVLTLRIAADVIFGASAAAAATALSAMDSRIFVHGTSYEVDYAYYAALALAAHYDDAPPERQAEYRRILAGEMERWQAWEERCPANFQAPARLVAAETARLDSRLLEAMDLYEAAIQAAREQGILPREALAWERAARFYRGRGLAVSADAYLREARRCYAAWGATAKVAAIDAAHPGLQPGTPVHVSAGSLDQIDALAIVRASQAISGEILIDRLVEALLTTAVEHAGADRGVLVLPQPEGFAIEAEVVVAGYRLEVRLQRAPVTPQALPESVLRYVARSRESLILDDGPTLSAYASDPYLRHCQPRSLLCLPLLRQGELVGLLYLENRLASQAFGHERLSILELLAGQAAISLENARLYAELREENAERQRAEAALEGSRALLKSIIDNSAAVIFVKDLEGRYLLVNRCYEQLFHVRNEEMIGRTDYDLFAPDLADTLRMADRRVLAADAPLEFEENVPQADGMHCYLALKFPLRDGRGQAYAVCGIATDITEHKQAEADRRARQAAEAASRAKSAFLATMSHELRTPLNAIIGYAQLLGRDQGLSERQADGLKTIGESGHHLLTLINDLLDFAKIESGKFELHPVPVNLESCLAVVAGIIRLKTEEKGLRFVCSQPDDWPPLVLADDKRLRQVLLNLLANGVKFTDRGEVGLRVELGESEPDRIRLRFAITDTGIGIAADQLETIFQPFEQVGDAGRRAGGTGLGLPISRQLVRLMGGDIRVDSRLGEGSTFRFDLLLPVHDGAAGMATGLAAAGEGGMPASALSPPLRLPSRGELEALHRLAQAGNMRDIRAWAEELAARDEGCRPFAERLQLLARGYQSRALLALVEAALAGDALS